MDRSDYDEKMNKMLDDEKTYKELDCDPVQRVEKRMNAMLLEMKKKGSLSHELYNRLRSSGGLTPRLYGLPKVHKPDVPLRPIVSFIQSPSYQLSRHLSKILSPLIGKSESHVQNSAEFASFVQSMSLKPNETLVSFDVVSLFTNVPVELAVKVARRRLELDSTLGLRTNLTTDELVQLLTFCLGTTYLSFRGRVLQQKFGTAMGSPVSVSAANLVMEDVEERALSTFDTSLPFWKRYVDDTCTAVPADKVESLLQHLNGIEDSIQFTVEVESNGQIPFLDVLLTHEADGSISTNVYRKPTHTDRYLDFESHHPISHKRSVISTLLSRADKNSSTATSRKSEEEHVASALKHNGYPVALINQESTRRHRGPKPQKDTEWKSSIVIPYVRGVSEAVRRTLAQLKVRVCYKPHRTLRQLLSNPKDTIPDLQKSGVVYQIPCASCSASYIGQSGRRLEQRIKEHKRAVATADLKSSALAEHAWSNEHTVDWRSVKVLTVTNDYNIRVVREAFAIRTARDAMNRDGGALPHEYENLISKPTVP